MLPCWREHCGRLTAQQLNCAIAADDHIKRFEQEVVRQGLQGTPLGDCADVQVGSTQVSCVGWMRGCMGAYACACACVRVRALAC